MSSIDRGANPGARLVSGYSRRESYHVTHGNSMGGFSATGLGTLVGISALSNPNGARDRMH